MNNSYDATFIDYVTSYFSDAVKSEFGDTPEMLQNPASYAFFRKMSTVNFIDVMIGPFNRRGYGQFTKWLTATGRVWNPTQQAEFARDKINPRASTFKHTMLDRLKEDIYAEYEENAPFERGIRNDDESGWAEDIAAFIMQPGEGHGFSQDKGQEIVDKLGHYADALIRMLGSAFFTSLENRCN